MKVKTIFIANLAEVARPLAKFMPGSGRRHEIEEDHNLCDRFVFSGGEDRALVTPYPLDQSFLEDSLKLLNYKNVLNLWPKSVGESVCQSILKDAALLKHLERLILENKGIRIISYAATPEFLELVQRFKNRRLEFETPEAPSQNQWTTAFFDSKAGFRQAVEQFRIDKLMPPEGYICTSPKEIVGWASFFLKSGRGFVIKANRGLSGAGLKIVTKEMGKKIVDLSDFVKSLLSNNQFFAKDVVVVEEYFDPDLSICGGSPSVEVIVDSAGASCPYDCGMRITPEGVFLGVELGRGAVPALIDRKMRLLGKKYGTFLYECGYRGYFDVDFALSKTGQFSPLESNLRRTGGTHVFELCQRLLGNDFTKRYYVTANNMNPAPKFKGKSYAGIKETLRPLLYPIYGKKEGIVITITSLLKRGDLGYAVIGGNRQRVYELEKQFLSYLN